MTDEQYNRLKEQNPYKYSKQATKLIDEGRIGMMNASILLKLAPDTQDLFLFEAIQLGSRQLASVVNHWLKMNDDERRVRRQILTDIYDAFEGWDDWTGNKGSAAEQDEFEQMVKEARLRVLCHIHNLKWAMPNGGIVG